MTILRKLWGMYEHLIIFLTELIFRERADEQMRVNIVSFADFCLVGVMNTIVSLGCYYIVVIIEPRLYLLGYCIGFVLSVLNAYFWNSNFVFHKTDEKARTILKTALSYGMTFVMGNALLYLFVDMIGISELIAPLLQIMITTPINYIMNKKWSFKKKQNE